MKKLSLFLTLLGIMVILSPFVIKKYNEYKSNQILMEIEKNMEFEKKKSIPTEKPSETPKPISNTLIKIDRIDLKLPIVEGISEKSLKYAIGSFRKDIMPGDIGNYSLAGHRNYTYGKMFNRLNELEKGDLIEIKKEDKSFYYKVSQILIVDPEEIWVLKDEKDKKTITLITCHPIGIANQRLIIKGELRE